MPLGVRSRKSSDLKANRSNIKAVRFKRRWTTLGRTEEPPGQSRPPSTFEDARAACVRASLRSEGPPGGVGRGVGGGVGGGGLNRLVGHDASGELLLSLLETGAGGTVQRVHLEGTEGEPVVFLGPPPSVATATPPPPGALPS